MSDSFIIKSYQGKLLKKTRIEILRAKTLQGCQIQIKVIV